MAEQDTARRAASRALVVAAGNTLHSGAPNEVGSLSGVFGPVGQGASDTKPRWLLAAAQQVFGELNKKNLSGS